MEGLVGLCISLWKNYFITEYHSTDEVAGLEDKSESCVLKGNVERMAELKFLQRSCLNYTMYEPSVFQPYLREIERRLNPPQDVKSYTWQELLAAMRGAELPANRERMNWSVQGKFSNWKTISGKPAELLYHRLMNVNASTEILTGNVGNSGSYVGRVSVIHHTGNEDIDALIDAMEPGNVLVSGSTGSELMLACKKAGAIITDEGGIISHAVLISREFGIPSVIGTRHATKILKDGDWVEVDAIRGVVKLCEKINKFF